MKCVHCGTDSDYKARQAGRGCRECGRGFAFEPKRDRGLTDLTFKLAIEAVSDGGRLAWTEDWQKARAFLVRELGAAAPAPG